MPVTSDNRVLALRRRLDVTQKVLARLLGVTERTVHALESGGEVSEALARRLTELERLARGLARVVQPRAVGAWLTRANPAFDGDTPADLIARGKIDLLWQMIHELRSGSTG